MTRINCVSVQELSDKHLGAEYRELPRVFTLAAAAYDRGEDPEAYPQEYVLGRGHVKFFYTRLLYLKRRFDQIVEECQRRGRNVQFPKVDLRIVGMGKRSGAELDESLRRLEPETFQNL